jgi:glycosyltransferase involved in cell wall biosynthesis
MDGNTTTSVIIPVRNGARFILEALDSVLAQLADDDEIIVVDDASTDGTDRLLRKLDQRVVILDGPRPGPSAARNTGLAKARGACIAFLDHDDLWPPGRHAALLGALLQDPAANAAAGRLRVRVEDDGSAGGHAALNGHHAPSILMTCLYRRQLIEATGRFDEDMRFGEDLNYYVRLAECGMVLITCDHDALVYRRHGGNATNAAPPGNTVLLDIFARKLARRRGSSAPKPQN